MTFFENIARRLGTYLLAGAMTVGGCSGYIPLSRDRPYPAPSGCYTETGIRGEMSLGSLAIDSSKDKLTVPIHPADGDVSNNGVVMGQASTISYRAGLERSYGTEDIRFKTGIDGRIAYTDRSKNIKMQELPSGYESYGYSDSSLFTLSPFFGFDSRYKDIGFSMEFGLPFSKGEYEIGHYRWDDYDRTSKYSWEEIGKSITIKLGYHANGFGFSNLDPDKVPEFGLVYTIERYKTNFGRENAGIEIQSISIIWPF